MEYSQAVLVDKPCPDFTAPTVLADNQIDEEFNLQKYLNDSYGLVFFYPLDFTFVCPSEIIAFDNRIADFEERNCKIVAISVDSHFTHLAWKNTPREEGGIGNVKFPMVADLTKDIARAFGVLVDNSVALRGSFLIDKEGVIRHQIVNDLPLGRNVDDAIRMVDCLQFHEEHGEVCPAGWNKGEEGIEASPDGIAKYLTDNAETL